MPGRGCSDARATQLAAAFGLAVGVAWGVLALMALLASTCVFPERKDSLIWLVYFYVAERWQRVARREGRPPPTCFAVYFAWLLAALLDVVLDAVFIPHYALDISHSKGARNVMELLKVSTLTPGWQQALPEWVTQSPALPPIVFLIVGSRVAPFLWAAEGVAVGRVATAARRLHKRRRQMLRRSVRDSQVPTASSAGPSMDPSLVPSEEPTAGPSQGSSGSLTRLTRPPPPPPRTSQSDSEDDGWPDSLGDSATSSTPSPRSPVLSPWSRLSLLLTAPGGDGDRSWRWSYVPLTEQSPSPPDPRPRYTSQPLP